jgi:hypothetical protein
MSINNIYFCPKCWSNQIRSMDHNQGFPEFFNNNFQVGCGECGWIGEFHDAIKGEEGKNVRRTKLIDKMLK